MSRQQRRKPARQARGPAKPKPKDTSARRLPSQRRARTSVALCLRAAQKRLERDGIDGVTTKKIADTAGLSVGAVNGYFPNKEAIICRLGATWMEAIRASIGELDPRRSGIVDAITYVNRVIETGVHHYASDVGLATVINMLSAIPELRQLEREHDRAIVDTCASAFAQFCPQVPGKELRALAQSVLSMSHATLSDAIIHRACDQELALRNLRLVLFAPVVHAAMSVSRAPG